MKRLRIAAFAAAALTLAAGSAGAVSLPDVDGAYEGAYNAISTNSGKNHHSFWLPKLGKGLSDYWQFTGDGGLFSHEGDHARLTGTITNNKDSSKAFAVDVALGFIGKGGRAPKCELGKACSRDQYKFQKGFFEYFEFKNATLTGIDMLAGLDLSLVMAPVSGKYPAQLGYGANNKDLDEFGLSTWFLWSTTSNTTGQKFRKKGQGDINVELSAVPIPATLPLLLGAFGVLAVVRRRRGNAQPA